MWWYRWDQAELWATPSILAKGLKWQQTEWSGLCVSEVGLCVCDWKVDSSNPILGRVVTSLFGFWANVPKFARGTRWTADPVLRPQPSLSCMILGAEPPLLLDIHSGCQNLSSDVDWSAGLGLWSPGWRCSSWSPKCHLYAQESGMYHVAWNASTGEPVQLLPRPSPRLKIVHAIVSGKSHTVEHTREQQAKYQYFPEKGQITVKKKLWQSDRKQTFLLKSVGHSP